MSKAKFYPIVKLLLKIKVRAQIVCSKKLFLCRTSKMFWLLKLNRTGSKKGDTKLSKVSPVAKKTIQGPSQISKVTNYSSIQMTRLLFRQPEGKLIKIGKIF